MGSSHEIVLNWHPNFYVTLHAIDIKNCDGNGRRPWHFAAPGLLAALTRRTSKHRICVSASEMWRFRLRSHCLITRRGEKCNLLVSGTKGLTAPHDSCPCEKCFLGMLSPCLVTSSGRRAHRTSRDSPLLSSSTEPPQTGAYSSCSQRTTPFATVTQLLVEQTVK
jgi:hypothetical protein